jgi:uncharacterized protein
MGLPEFPNFRKIDISDKETIERITSLHPPYSDFNFTSLYMSNIVNDFEFSLLHDNLIIHMNDYLTHEPFFTFLGTNNVSNTIIALLDLSQSKGYTKSLKLVPEICIGTLQNSKSDRIKIQEDRDNFDYILNVREICNLEGNTYYNQRNLVNRFNRRFPNCGVIDLDTTNTKVQSEILQLLFTWQKRKGISETEATDSRLVMERMFTLQKNDQYIATGTYINEVLVGFAFDEVLPDNYSIAHIRKGDTNFPGIYKFLEKCVAEKVLKLNCNYTNYTQDLGLPNLRKAKVSWSPSTFLKKYIVERI